MEGRDFNPPLAGALQLSRPIRAEPFIFEEPFSADGQIWVK